MPASKLKFSEPMQTTSVRLPQDLLVQFCRARNYIKHASGEHIPVNRSDALRDVIEIYLRYAKAVRYDLEQIDIEQDF